jgi:hypothetical protein
MIRYVKLLSSLFALSALGSTAFADALPPPEMMRAYTVEVSRPVSELLIQSAAFQDTQTVQLPATGPFGPCSAEIKTWTHPGGRGPTLSCHTRTSCFYKSGPSCSMSFADLKDRAPSDLLKILSANPVGTSLQ